MITKDAEVVLRILRPSTALELIELDRAASSLSNPTVYALNPTWLTAARLGVEFGINTLREAAELRTNLSAISPAGATFR